MDKGKPKEFFTPQDIADRIGVSVITVRRYIHDGKLTATRIGTRLLRISKEEADKFISNRVTE